MVYCSLGAIAQPNGRKAWRWSWGWLPPWNWPKVLGQVWEMELGLAHLAVRPKREGEHEENVLVPGSDGMAKEGGRWTTALVLQGGRGNGLESHAGKGEEKEVGEEMGLELG